MFIIKLGNMNNIGEGMTLRVIRVTNSYEILNPDCRVGAVFVETPHSAIMGVSNVYLPIRYTGYQGDVKLMCLGIGESCEVIGRVRIKSVKK